jgi:cyclohexa-1,5-dienecarbonyl-CoA hydratase
MTTPVRAVEERGGAWLRIILDRPPGNLLSLEMVRSVMETLSACVPPRRKWITFEGAGEHFSYGASVDEHLPGVMEHVLPETNGLLRHILRLNAATCALVQGRCLGGGFELALACDTIIASDDASMGLPEIKLCAFPPAGAALLPLRVGASRAAAAVLTGLPRTANDWHHDGLVQMIAPAGNLLGSASDWFDSYLGPRSEVIVGPAARATRQVFISAAEAAILDAEKTYLDEVLPTNDAREGVRAFMEKRAPRWAGH